MTLLKKSFFFLHLQQQAAHCGCDKFQSWMPCGIKDTITFTIRSVLLRIYTCVQLNNNVTWTVSGGVFSCVMACDHIRGIVTAAICSRTNKCVVTCGCPHPTPLLLLGDK